MQLLDKPRTGKLGPHVFYTDASGNRVFCRTRAIPANPQTLAQTKVRVALGYASGLWSRKLTEAQREQWIAAALNAPSDPWLGRYGHLSGQQLEVKINSTLQCIGRPPVLEPPQPVAFSPNCVTGMSIVNDPEAGVRLLLNVGTVTEDIMVFGQPACSAGRMKRRRVYYLGLAGAVTNGQIDITDLYSAKFGKPEPGKKVFIATCQTKDGWKAQDHVFSAIVPPPSLLIKQQSNTETKARAAEVTEPAEVKSASPQASSSVSHIVYTRSTQDALRVYWALTCVQTVSIPSTPLVHSLQMALRRLWMLAVPRLSPGWVLGRGLRGCLAG